MEQKVSSSIPEVQEQYAHRLQASAARAPPFPGLGRLPGLGSTVRWEGEQAGERERAGERGKERARASAPAGEQPLLLAPRCFCS